MKTLSGAGRKLLTLLLTYFCAVAFCSGADSITIQVDKPGISMSPTFYGLMTEEITHAYDGGLYGELVCNRIFSNSGSDPENWVLVKAGGASARMALDDTMPLNENLRTSLRIDVFSAAAEARAGAANLGYWGIPVKPGTSYRASFYAKADTNFSGPVTVAIESNDGATVYAEGTVPAITTAWKQYSLTLATGQLSPTTEARLGISIHQPGTIWLNLVSLFPPTYRDRPNGNRIDLMQLLAGMKPSFLRLPGGNYLEGRTIETRFDWKKTIGDLSERPGHTGMWGLHASDGLGLLEYMEWCEDVKMQPVLGLWAGFALNGAHVEAGPALQPYVQDAVDEIEYVTGDATTKWGAMRARDGHAARFPLTYVEIGNEDELDKSGSYEGRFAQFCDAIKAKYPALQIIATTPVTSRRPDLVDEQVDEHYHRRAQEMESDVTHYDGASRQGPKIIVGEWATTEGTPTPNMGGALSDAAWMIGLERNSDLVVMEAYAPLLVNINPDTLRGTTDLIGYDALHSFGSPSYYVQKMFAENHGQVLLPLQISAAPDATKYAPKGAIGVGTYDTQAEFRNLKVTHDGATLFESDFSEGMEGWSLSGPEWTTHYEALAQTIAFKMRMNGAWAIAGDPSWTDYTYELQARKITGGEGFYVLFHVTNEDRYVAWNLGGWGNTRTGLERVDKYSRRQYGEAATNTIEAGRWYDIKVEVKGHEFRGYLDGKLVTQAMDEPGLKVDPIHANATRDPGSGDLFLHVVNVTGTARRMDVNLEGVTRVVGDGTSIVLTGDPQDANTIGEPEKVAPKETAIRGVAASFPYEFPAYSVSVLRLNAR